MMLELNSGPDISWPPIIKKEVEKAITRLKERKACGPDKIQKTFKVECLELLMALFNNIYI